MSNTVDRIEPVPGVQAGSYVVTYIGPETNDQEMGGLTQVYRYRTVHSKEEMEGNCVIETIKFIDWEEKVYYNQNQDRTYTVVKRIREMKLITASITRKCEGESPSSEYILLNEPLLKQSYNDADQKWDNVENF